MSSAGPQGVLGWRCAGCGTNVDVATPHPFRCPLATPRDRAHVLHPLLASAQPAPLDDANPFVAYGPRQAWWAFATANGMTEAACTALAAEVAAGFAVTPLHAHPFALADDGAPATTVWVKDETGNVARSHKARHLMGILLHLRAAERLGVVPDGGQRAPLAIASCGNAAIAAATLAERAEWPLQVYVPDWASPAVLDRLEALGAAITACPRDPDGPPGDPAMARFRQAVDAGAIPFSVQGPENALCLDGGRTLGWELADAVGAPDGPDRLDRVLVQVGGGALAACVGWGLGASVQLDTVQAGGCAPLARAWWRAKDAALTPEQIPGRWNELMTAWEQPSSRADGIIDDETYDWLADFAMMRRSNGRPLVVPEEAIVRAHELALTTGVPVSPTGSAGLAGLLVRDGRPAADERIAVIFTGVER